MRYHLVAALVFGATAALQAWASGWHTFLCGWMVGACFAHALSAMRDLGEQLESKQ